MVWKGFQAGLEWLCVQCGGGKGLSMSCLETRQTVDITFVISEGNILLDTPYLQGGPGLVPQKVHRAS